MNDASLDTGISAVALSGVEQTRPALRRQDVREAGTLHGFNPVRDQGLDIVRQQPRSKGRRDRAARLPNPLDESIHSLAQHGKPLVPFAAIALIWIRAAENHRIETGSRLLGEPEPDLPSGERLQMITAQKDDDVGPALVQDLPEF